MLCAITLLALEVAAAAAVPTTTAATKAEAYYHFSLGIRARLARDERTALDELRKAQRADPASGAIRAEMARLLRDTSRIEEALAEAEEAARLEPGDPETQLVLAQMYYLTSASSGGSDALLDKAALAYEDVVKLRPRDAESLATLADIYRRRQVHEKAISAWQRFLEVDPGNFEGYLQLGQEHLALRQTKEAAAAFERALAIAPSPQAYQSLGAIHAQAQQPDEAVAYYRKALELEPNNMIVRLSLSETLLRARRIKEALAEVEGVLQRDPKNRFALNLKVQVLRDTRDFAGAEALANTLLSANARDLDAAFLKITIIEARRDWTAAAAALEAGLARSRKEEDPEQGRLHDHRLWLHLGVARQELGLYKDAAAAFAQARALDPDADSDLFAWEIQALVRAKAWATAAERVSEGRKRFPQAPELIALDATIRRERGQTAEAAQIIAKLRDEGDNDVAMLVEVAGYYRRGRQYAEAERALRRAREVEPRNTNVLFQLGAALERQKRWDDAEVFFREALAVQPDSAPILNYLGYMNANRGMRLDEAVTLIEKALALDPESAAYLDSLGWANFRRGHLELAEQLIRKAIVQMARNAVVLDHLGDVLERRGRLQEAVQCWEQALAGEDEDDELDQAAVQAKIRTAQTKLATPAASR
jgi:tetratricopeptide (TPR) repeat protein